MKRLVTCLVAVAAVVGIVVMGCAQLANAASPAQPSKVVFPEKGKIITLIIPFDPGGTTDIAARVMAPLMEKDLGVPIQLVNRPGANSQVGLTQLASSKPDGYALGLMNLPTGMTTYLDPDRKAFYTRKNFQPVGSLYFTPSVFSVHAKSPYRSVKNFVDAAKASPEKIKTGTSGILSVNHLALLQLAREAGVRFAFVHFSGTAPEVVALLGGHIDVASTSPPELLSHIKSGEVRALGIVDRKESRFLPGVPTVESQGYKVFFSTSSAVIAPAGIPREAMEALGAATKKAAESDTYKSKMVELGYEPAFLDGSQFAALWADMEAQTVPLVELVKQGR